MFTILIWSCSLDPGNNSGYLITLVPTVSITSIIKTRTGVNFAVIALGGSSCTGFSHYEATKQDTSFYIKIFSKRRKSDICLDVIIEFNATGSIKIDRNGTYKLRFCKTDSSSVDTSFVYP